MMTDIRKSRMNAFWFGETKVRIGIPMAIERSVSEICEVLRPFLGELGSALYVAHVRFDPCHPYVYTYWGCLVEN